MEEKDKVEVLQQIAATQQADYNELSAVWRDVTTKARGTLAACGVFIGATFAFAQSIDNNTPIEHRIFLCLAILLLLFVLGHSVAALKVRDYREPPHYKGIPTPGSTSWEEVRKMLETQVAEWPDTNQDLRRQNSRINSHVESAQYFFVGFVVVIAFLAAYTIVSPR